MFFFQNQPDGAGQNEGNHDFQQIVARGRLLPAMDKLMETAGKDRNDGQHRAALNDHVEQIRLAGQPMFSNEEMARGRRRQKVGYSRNEGEQNDAYTIRHPNVRGENSPPDKGKLKRGARNRVWETLFFLFEERVEKSFGFLALLRDFELAQGGMPADVQTMPLAFEVAEGRVVHLAEIAERGRAADQGEDFLLGGRAGLDGGEDQFHLLDDHALGFEELALFLGAEFFGAGQVDEMDELLPAFRVVLQFMDELNHFLALHRHKAWRLLRCATCQGLWNQENNRATAQFPGRKFQGGIPDDQFRQRRFRGLRGPKSGQHLLADV